MAPVHYYKMAQSPLPGRSCPKTASELILITPQNIRLLIITVIAICLTALSAVSNDEAEANNHDSSKPFSESHNSLNEQQKVFRKGDTLTSLLKESKVSDADIFAITRLLARKLNLNEIHVGQTFLLYSYKTGKDKVKVHGLILQDPGELQWTIVRSATDTLVFQKLTKAQLLAAIQSSVRLKKSADAETPFSNTIRLKQGDTLIGLLRDLGLNETDIKDAVESLTPLLNLRHLQVNQRFELKLQSLNGNIRLVGLTAIGTRAGNITIALPLKRRGSSAAPTTNPDKSEKSAAQTNYPMTHGSESSTPHVKVNPEISTSNVPNNVLRKELLVLEKGDSFASRLIHTGVNARDAFNAAQALSQNTDLSRLPVGQEIHLLFSKNPKTNPFLMSVIISPNSARPLRVNRQKDGTYN